MAKEVKVYRLTGGRTPLSLILANRHTHRKSLLWFDEKTEKNRAIKFANNQSSIFEDEQDGHAILGTIEFKDGTLTCHPRRDATLINFLELHPDNTKNGGSMFEILDHEKEAEKLLNILDLEYKAADVARNLSLEEMEQIGHLLFGNKARNLKTKELERDIKIYARNNPEDFLEMFEDTNSNMRGMIERAIDMKIVQLRKDKTQLFWNTDKKTMITHLPKTGNAIENIEMFFTSKEGMSIFEEIAQLVENN
jgi:hypothetical protein